jgi:hypothetical protein
VQYESNWQGTETLEIKEPYGSDESGADTEYADH